jgi:hypothetical protein
MRVGAGAGAGRQEEAEGAVLVAAGPRLALQQVQVVRELVHRAAQAVHARLR